MRKLIVASFVSLDGVVEAPMSWIGNYFDDEGKNFAYKKLMDVEFFLLGRVTYEMFSAVWPHVKGDKYIDRINGLKKLVASRTLKEVTWNASLMPAMPPVNPQDQGPARRGHLEIWSQRAGSDARCQSSRRRISPVDRADACRSWQTSVRRCRRIPIESQMRRHAPLQ